jgi:hypothetical protein
VKVLDYLAQLPSPQDTEPPEDDFCQNFIARKVSPVSVVDFELSVPVPDTYFFSRDPISRKFPLPSLQYL